MTGLVAVAAAAAVTQRAGATLVRSRDWASSLFNGLRLTIEIVAEETEAFETWLAALPEAEFAIRGYFVASADLIERRAGAAVVEFLLVEEQ